MSQRLRGFKESAVETVFLVKVCLTCFWFWLPVLFAACFFIQLWMIVMIHPLTLFILPGILSIYSMLENEKRLKLQYGLEKKRRLKALHHTTLACVTTSPTTLSGVGVASTYVVSGSIVSTITTSVALPVPLFQ